jgi:hypothetical protein
VRNNHSLVPYTTPLVPELQVRAGNDEPKPWPMLTLIVSLEAIFLSTFVMIGQNQASGLPAGQGGS